MAIMDVSEILGHWGWSNDYTTRVIGWLKESDYKEKLKTSWSGTTIEGNPEEIFAYVKQRFDEWNGTITDDKQASNSDLKHSVELKKQSLPSGSQYYEYKSIVIKDSEIVGTVDSERIDLVLNSMALDGWRLKEAITNEIGHNHAVVVNATINNTILIFERLVTKE